MLKQYHASRFRGGSRHREGTIGAGSIVYLQDGCRPMGRFPEFTRRREPWIVEAWHNREYFPAVKGARAVVFMLGGHLATVRSLRTGRRAQVADWILRAHDDAGLLKLDWSDER